MIDWIKSKLVDDLSVIWARWSVKIVAAQVVVLATWGALAAFDLTPTVPEWGKWLALLVLSSAAITAATLKQKKPDA